MCYHNSTPGIDAIEFITKGYDLKFEEFPKFFHANGFDHPQLPVMTNEDPHLVQPVEWGLVPFWAKDKSIANQTLNAVSETAFEKPAFRDSIKKRRCLIWVDGFFEWKHVGKEKTPYYIYIQDHHAFTLGGLWSEWTDKQTGEVIKTCSILTTPANELMTEIHNTKKRMPLILTQQYWDIWFDDSANEDNLKGVMQPFPEGILQCHEISKIISKRGVETNIPEIQKPVNEQGRTLF
jgi:putative SOS response-associated peptidase YedK